MKFRETNLPNGWVWSTIEETCEIILGQSPPSESYNTRGIGLPFYQGKAEFGDLYPTPVKWCWAPKKVAKAEDILISVRAPVGPTNLCPEKSCIGRGLAAIRPRSDMPSKYFLYYLRHIENDWDTKSTGTTFKAITGSILRTTKLPLAPLTEQYRVVEKIEELLTQLDAGLQELTRVQAKLTRYKASVLKAACEGRLVPTEAELARAEGRDYESGEALLQRILADRKKKWEEEQRVSGKDPSKVKYREPEPPYTERLPELPEGWIWAKVDQIATVIGGLTKNRKRKDYPLKLPYLRVGNVYENELRLDNVKSIGIREEELERILLKDQDLLIVEGNGSLDQIGRVAIWNGSISPCVHQNHIIKIRFVNIDMVKFILYWLISEQGRIQITKVASSTSGLYTLSLSKVSNLDIPLPPIHEQKRIISEIERRLSIAKEMENSVQANLRRAARLQQAILKRAFEAKLVPQDAEDEPAAVLLQRMKLRMAEGEQLEMFSQ